MRHKGWMTIGMALVITLAAGALWADGAAAPVEDKPDTTPQPETVVPPTSPPAEMVGLLCGPNLPACNSGDCGGSGCTTVLNTCEFENLGIRCCNDNGTALVCDQGETVWSLTCDCGNGPGPGFCEQTRTKTHSCS